MNDKTLKIIGWSISGLVALIFITSAVFKFTGGNPEMVNGIGGKDNLLILGVLEIIITLLFLYPRTSIVGTLLAMAYMGGAIAVHFVGNQSVLVPMLIEIMIWVSAFLRYPKVSRPLLIKS